MLDYDTKKELDKPNAGFRFLHDPNQIQNSAVLLLRWCVSPRMAEYLRDFYGEKYVFIDIRDPSGRHERRIASLIKTPQELIEFHRPGEHTITGSILWGCKENIAKAKEKFLERTSRLNYAYNLEGITYYCHRMGEAILSVEVPDGFFAPAPSWKESFWLDLWQGPVWDECELRRRRAFTYFVKAPVAIFLYVPFSVGTRFFIAFIFGIVFAKRNVDWGVIVHPFMYRITDVLKGEWDGKLIDQPSWLLHDQSGYERPLSGLLRFLVPWKLLALVFAALGLGELVTRGSLGIGLFATILLVLFVFATLGAPVLGAYADRSFAKAQIREDARSEEFRQREAARNEALYALLVCSAPSNGMRPPAPGIRNKVVLTYQRVKAAVCRPIART